jgi:uncharacterized protein YndB with AHSA1/START domain
MTAKITHDATGRRSIALEFEVPGTPEQVWQAIATGPGITSWFSNADVEERKGGAVAFHMGAGIESSGTVTAWDPPVRFAYEEPNWSPSAPPLATEFIIESRSGGTCVVRLVHSLFASGEDWDDQLKGFETGWVSLFNVLRLYLANFFGERCTNLRGMAQSPSSEADTWRSMTRAMGLEPATPGTRVTVSFSGAPALAGTVERAGENGHRYEALVRLDDPAPGTALIGAYTYAGSPYAMITLFLYGDRGASTAARVKEPLASWIEGLFPVSPGVRG